MPPLITNEYFISQQRWLKPGGQLLITDYCCSPDTPSEQFKKYLEERQYHLIDVESYGKVSLVRSMLLVIRINWELIALLFKQQIFLRSTIRNVLRPVRRISMLKQGLWIINF